MKTIIIIIEWIAIIFVSSLYSQPCSLSVAPIKMWPAGANEGYADFELVIYNQTLWKHSERSDTVMVKMLPVGTFFNADFKYNPHAKYPVDDPPHSTSIAGCVIKIPPQSSSTSYSRVGGNWDKSGSSGSSKFAYGFGKYKLEFYRLDTTGGNTYWEYVNYVYMDFSDAGNNNLPPIYGNIPDIRLDYFSKDTITFHFSTRASNYLSYDSLFWHINSVNKEIKMWDLFGTCLPSLTPDKGLFSTDSTNNGSYLILPINANQYNNNIGQENPGDLGMNLVVNHDVTTRETLIDTITKILIPSHGLLKIDTGKSFNMIKPVIPANGSNNLIVQDTALLLLSTNSELIVGNQNKLTLNKTGQITLYPGSKITFQNGSSFCNLGGRIFGPGRIDYQYGSHILCREVVDNYYSDSAKIVLEDNAVLEIPDSTILHFSGNQSGLIMKPNSKLNMGEGSKILFDSGASIFANGAAFTSIDSTLKWDGIILNNSDADTITNCTFSNAVTALTFTNNSNSAYKNRIIINNTFNIPGWGVNKGIYGENNYKILIKNNVFNMPVYFPSSSPVSLIYVGVYLKNSSTLEAAGGDIEEDQSTNYSLNIIENTFSNGCASVILANYTSNYLPYLISDNTFNNTASVNIIGMKISGTIRDNSFTSEYVPLGIHLINSNPNLYKNTINSRDVGLHLAGHCYPNLAPYVSGENLVWTGGNNYFTTEEIDNIQLSSSGYVNTDFGNNNFTINNSSSYHIYGWLDSTHNIYYARDNCWNGSAQSRIYLKTYGSSDTVPVAVVNLNNYDCSGEINPSGWNVSYNGNGVYDSIKLSDDNTGEQPSEADILYAQAVSDLSNGLPVQAIIDFKYLTDNYPEYEDLPKILYEFYSCYQMLDTNEGQNYRQPLYQDIVDYLNEKLLSDDFTKNSDFIDNAFDIILMAESIIDLNSAAGGYEFLAFNHPDPDIRLTASWNYNEIQELINSGEGGGQLGIENYELGIEELRELKEFQRMDKLVSDDPVMSKMKRTFEKTLNERNERIDKQLSRESTNGEIEREKTKRSRQIDIQKEDRAKRNIFESKNMNKVEKEMRRMEDMALSTLDIRNEIKINPIQNIPNEYKLEQNYPNPFNPSTTIQYSISHTQYTILKIYDVLGKEVKTLVNETKPAGIYKIEFNGSSLSSGMYFYKLEAGNFTKTKRMLLIK